MCYNIICDTVPNFRLMYSVCAENEQKFVLTEILETFRGAKVKFEIIKERTYINGGVEKQEENK